MNIQFKIVVDVLVHRDGMGRFPLHLIVMGLILALNPEFRHHILLSAINIRLEALNSIMPPQNNASQGGKAMIKDNYIPQESISYDLVLHFLNW